MKKHFYYIVFRGRKLKLKYCDSCRLYRPMRASHCKMCDNCVEHLDHHCPWLGSCLGRRNYPFFFWFVNFLFAYILFTGAALLTHLAMKSQDSLTPAYSSISKTVYLVVDALFVVYVVVVSALIQLGVFVGLLCVFHYCLAKRNWTTREYVKREHVATSRSYCYNLCHKLWRKHIPPRVK